MPSFTVPKPLCHSRLSFSASITCTCEFEALRNRTDGVTIGFKESQTVNNDSEGGPGNNPRAWVVLNVEGIGLEGIGVEL